MSKVDWDIRREGRSWSREEVRHRYDLSPEKIELIEGKLFWTEDERLIMLGLLLENVGVDKAIRLGDRRVWHEALSELDNSE